LIIEQLPSPERNVHFTLGARLKSAKEIYETVLSRGRRCHEVHGRRTNSGDPSPLKVKDVRVDDRRYVVCYNEEQALKYKQLWMVEAIFRSAKSLLEKRPIFHKLDETIRGHVSCSFLASVLKKERYERFALQGDKLEWAEILRDLAALRYADVEHEGKQFRIRTEVEGACTAVCRDTGVAIPPTVQPISPR